MNRLCYKTVFSKHLGALVAVGEHATSQSKSPGEGSAAGELGWRDVRFVCLLAVGFAAVSLGWSQTLPQGAQVTQGGVSVSQSGSQMSITQTTPKAVVNWQSFDIGQNAKVNVLQPNSQSVLLNRVLSDNPTQILGQLQANGQVVLVNPKGIVVGSDGSVSASAFTASTLNISDADFMAGASRYVRGDATGSVINKGVITSAPGGYVALLGSTVQNEGRIVSPQGAVVMGAGDAAVLPQVLTQSLYMPVGRSGKIKLELTPATVNAWVKNEKSGVIVTEGGQVYMQAAAVHSAMASVLQSGSINTSAAQAGEVHLLADGGRIVVDGQIKANSSDANAKGGSILIGRDVDTGVLAASTDVSGATLESQKGFVETSGQHLVVDGIQVKAGEWLLDPTDITIGAAATSGIASSGTNPITQNPNTSGTTASTISATTLASTLSGGTSVVVKTTNASGTGNGDITVASNIAVTGTADATLTLQAERDIVVNAGVSIARTGSNKLNVVLNSDLDGINGGAIVMNTGSSITSNGGNINLAGGSFGNGSGYALGYSARPNGLELIGATINAGGGNIQMNGQGGTSSTTSGRGVVMTNSTVSTTGSGDVAVFGIGGVSTNIPSSFSLGHNNGVLLDGGSVTGGSSGSTWIWGQGGARASAYNYGVSVTNSATVTSTGGNVTVQGTGGGSGSSDRNIGVQISQSAQVTSSGGNVNVDGTGGNTTGGLNAGVAVVDGGKITVSGSRNLTVTATGGGNSSTSGGDNMGLWMAGTGTGAPLIESASGNISITGAAGGANTSGGRNGVSLTGASKINSTAGQVTLTTDSINLADSSLVSANTTSGTVTVRNRTAGTLVNVGGTAADAWASVPNTLALSQAELGKISAATTLIGRNDATGAGNLTVTGPVNMGTMGNPNGNLTLTSGANITVNDNISKTAGTDANLSLRTNGDISVAASKTITSTSNKLNVVLNSDSDGSGAGGIILNAGAGITSNSGSITLGGGSAGDGSGFAMGNASGSGFYGAGVQMFGADVNAGAGNILINGKGNLTNTGIYNYGVFIDSSNDASSGTGSRVRTSGGNVVINGTGGGAGGSYANVGIQVDYNSEVSTQGAGALTMTGIGGSTSTGTLNNGMYIARGAKLTTVNGQMNLTGTGATSSTSGGSSEGLYLLSDSSITSTGTGNVNITATGGVGGANNNGLRIDSGSTNTISTASGNVDITTTGGAGGSFGLNSTGSTNAIRSTTGNVTVTSDSVNWDATTSLTASAGTVTIQNRTAGTLINVGGADVLSGTPLTLGLNSVEYGRITAANTVIGRNDSTGSGNMTVNSAVSTNAMGNLTLRSGNNITVGSGTGITKTAGAADTTLKLLANNEILVSSNLTASGTGVGKQNIVLNSDSDGSGAGAIEVSNAASIISNGGNITMGGGVAGDGSGNARGYTSANGNRAAGVFLNRVTVNAGGGNIAMNGQGSATTISTAQGGFQAFGVGVKGSVISTTGAGNINLQGQGGSGSDTNAGVAIDQISGTASTVTGSTTGTVTITGTGGAGTASGNNNYNFGLWMAGNSKVTTTGGSVNVTGTGTGQGSNKNNSGVMVQNSANLGATGAGTVTVTGTGGNSTGGTAAEPSLSNGVEVFNNGTITSESGAINITGTNRSSTPAGYGIALSSNGSVGGKISSTGNAPVTLTTDSLWMDSSTSATINAGTGTVTIQNKTAGTKIDVGGSDVQTVGAETLAVSNAELRNITAGNVVIGKSNAGDLTVSSNVTTNTTTGNVTLLSGGNMAINATLNVGDDPATTPAVEASNTLTLNAVGASSTVTDGTSGAIKAANLELLGATAAYTLDSASNAVTRLAGNTGSVTFVDSTTLRVDRVNTINSANTVTGTVGLTTTGNVNLSGTTTLANTDGLLVTTTNPITVTGPGSITLTGNSATTIGLNVSANVSATTGTITINGSSNSNTGVYIGNGQISSRGAIAVTGTSASGLGVNLDDASGSVTSLTGGSNFAGADAIAITGSTSTGAIGVLIRRAVTNNSTNGATTIKSTRGNIQMDRANGVITNGSTAGAINLFAGNETNSSTAGIVANAFTGPGPQIVQNANADVVLTTDGSGNLSSPKIAKNSTGAGDIVLAAGKLLAAGVATGGQVKPVAGNSVTNSGTGSLYVYSGSPTSANTAAMSSLDASLANLYLSAVGTNAQNADANVAYATSGVRNTIAGGPKAQVLFREKVSVGTISGATVAKTYGDANTGSTETAALWTDMTAALKTANATSGVSNVNSTSTTAGTLQVTRSAIVDTLTGSLQSTAYSTSQKLKANTSGYTYSAPVSSKYTTALTAGQSAIVTVARKALTPSVTANNKVYNDSTAASLASQTVSGVVSGDVVGLNSTGAAFDTQHVGTGKTVTATGLSLSGTDAANYSLTSTSTTTTANVTAKALTLAAVTDTKTYDGTTNSGATVTVTGLEGNDTASVSQAFASKNVMGPNGSSLQVNSGYTINDGNSGNNYSVSTSKATGTINKAALTVAMSNQTKTYDGTTAATLASGAITATGVTVNGVAETASVSQTVGTYNNKNVTGASSVTASLASNNFTAASGTDLNNYNLPTTVTGTGAITKANLTLSGTRVYDASTSFAGSNLTATGVNGETFSLTGAGDVSNLASKNVQTSQTLSSVTGLALGAGANGGISDNYNAISTTGSSVSVTRKSATVSATATTKTYNGLTQSQDAATSSDFIDGDTITITGESSGKNAGTYTSALSVGGTDAGNYSVAITNADLTINKANLTLSGTRVYDASTSFAGSNLTATGVNGETFSLTGAGDVSNLASKNVQTSQTLSSVTGLALGAGANGGISDNYNAISTTGSSVSVTRKSATVSATATTKTYNGLTQSQDAATSSDFIDGDTITITGESSGKNAGTYTSNLVVSGADASNYIVSITNADLMISKANLTVAMSNQTKGYDGTTAATLASGAITATGVTVNGVAETATVSQASGTYNTKDVATANAVTANLASADFTAAGATDLNNYNLPTSVTGAGSITAKSVTYAGLTVNNKTYDRTTAATLGGTAVLNTVTAGASQSTDAKVIATDTVSLTGTAVGTYVSKDVAATNNTVTFSGLSLTGGDAGNYTLVQQASVNGTGTIKAKTLTASVQANDKTYDGTASATLKSTNGMSSADVISGDSVTFSNSSVSFADRHVAKDSSGNVVGKTVTVSGLALGGADSSNYELASTSATTTAKITPKALTLAAVTDSKTYDGTTDSSGVVTALALASGDTITATQSFGSKDVMGTNVSTLQVNSGFKINDSNNGNNYSVSTSTATGTISQKALTVTANDDAKFVTQDDASNFNGVSYSGFAGLEDASVLGGTLNITRTNASTNVGAGTYAGTLEASGLTSGNYSISYVNGKYTIVPANQLLIRTEKISTVYGTAPTYDTTAQYLDRNNVIHTLGQSIDGSTYTFSDGAGGSVATVLKPYTVSGSTPVAAGVSTTGNTVVGNYSILDTNPAITGSNFVGSPVYVGNLTVTPKPLTAAMAASNKVYDGGVLATVSGSSTQIVTGDKVSFDNTSATFDTKNAGTGKTVSVSGIKIIGDDAANYALQNTTASTTADISPKEVTLTAGNVSKTYDGGLTYTTKTADLGTLSDQLISGDVVTSATIKFGNKNAGSINKTVSLDAVTISDGNYTITRAGNNTSTITQKAAKVNGTATSKTYNGLTQTQTAATSSGFVNGDAITISGESSGQNAGTYTSNLVVGGVDAGNYSIAITNADLTIAKANLTVAMSAQTKTYDGTTAATLASGAITATGVTVNGVAETANVNQTVGTYNSKDVATANAVTASLASNNFTAASGVDLNNYNLPTTVTGTGTITRANLAVEMSDQTKTYDGTTAATLASGAITATTGVTVNNVTETISVNQTSGTYNNKNVSGASTVTASLASSNFTAGSSTDLNNYILPASVDGRGAITAKSVAYVGLTVSDKTYDRTTAATLGGTAVLGTVTAGASLSTDAKVIATDTVSLTGTAVGTYVSKDVAATNNTVTFSGLSLTGGDAGNYTLVQQASVNGTGTIKAKTLTASVQANDKTYDGTASATLKSTNGMSSADVISGDSVTFSNSSASFGDRHVAKDSSANVVGKTVTVTGLALGGADASNYELASTSATTTAKITPKALTLAAVTDTKTYDGTTSSSKTVTVTGLVGDDGVIASQAFEGKNVMGANGTTLQVNNGYTINDGNSGNNYSVSTSTASGTITPAPLTFIGTKVADKNYDGTTRASVTAGTISGLVGNETLRIAQTDGEFESSSPGPHKRVNVVYRLANGEHGGLASNYTWAPVISTAQIFGLAKDQRYKPEVPSSSAISRVRYLGFNGMSGAAVSSLFLAPWLSQSSLCTASRLENCICESAEDPMVEFCVAPISNAAK